MFLDRFYPPEADPVRPVYCDGNCGTEIVITPMMGLSGPPYLCHECAEIQEKGDEEEMTIGQLVDALRQKCLEDLGVKVNIDMYAHWLPDHDKAEAIAMRMTQELQGQKSEIHRGKTDKNCRWYTVDGNGRKFTAFWDEKENTAREQAVV